MKNRDRKQASLTPEELLRLRIDFYVFASTTQVVLQDILTLIDSPAFLCWIKNLRSQLGISKVPFMDFKKLLKFTSIINSTRKTKLTDEKVMAFIAKASRWQEVLSAWNPKTGQKRKILETETENILRKLRRPYYLADIAMQAMLIGKVGWDNQLWRIINNGSYIPKPSVAIFINPRTTYPELKEAIKQVKSMFFRPRELEDGSVYKPKLPNYVPNVYDYHLWYWERIKGKTYAQIANEWVDNRPDDPEQAKIGEIEVLKGVRKYKSLLSF